MRREARNRAKNPLIAPVGTDAAANVSSVGPAQPEPVFASQGMRMCRATPRRFRGFSLLELMFTLSMLAILLGLAVPGVNTMLLDSRRATAVNSFVHAVFLARSTAGQRGRPVTICRSTDGQTCSHSTVDWQDGWIEFVNEPLP